MQSVVGFEPGIFYKQIMFATPLSLRIILKNPNQNSSTYLMLNISLMVNLISVDFHESLSCLLYYYFNTCVCSPIINVLLLNICFTSHLKVSFHNIDNINFFTKDKWTHRDNMNNNISK